MTEDVGSAQHLGGDEPSGSVPLSDGRTVAFMDGGDPSGYPVIGLHGTPGCRLNRLIDDSVYVEAGVRYVTTDRAGYGRSTRHPGRCVADEAGDVLAVADALGFERFAVVGGSGGGPHALACAALLAGRVERVACQSSLAPLGPTGLTREQWVTGMDPEIAAELTWAEAGEDVLTPGDGTCPGAHGPARRRRTGSVDGAGGLCGGCAVPARPEVIAAFRRIVPEQARHGVGCCVDDTLAFVRDWDFDLASITVPVLLTYGDQDSSCPVAHGRFLARAIRAAVVVEVRDEGHFARDPREEVLTTHRWLRFGHDAPVHPGP